MTTSKNSIKLEYISQIRVLSLLLIVSYHSICFYLGKWGLPCADVVSSLWNTIAPALVNIGLTGFVLISGFLYSYLYSKGKYHDFFPFIKGKAVRLLIPYFIWSLFIIYLIPDSGQKCSGMYYGIAHLWFLLMLFEIFLIVSIVNIKGFIETSSTKVDVFVLIISVLPLFITRYILNIHFPLAFELTVKYLPVFMLGYFAYKHSLIDKMSSLVLGSLLLIGGGYFMYIDRLQSRFE